MSITRQKDRTDSDEYRKSIIKKNLENLARDKKKLEEMRKRRNR